MKQKCFIAEGPAEVKLNCFFVEVPEEMKQKYFIVIVVFSHIYNVIY